jgi:parvulin-like peptidyl-prolyl isomerase
MIDEALIRNEAARRGISVSEAEIQTEIEQQFDFYGGDLPPASDADPTPVPTPSVTPIVSADAEPTATVEAEPTVEPTPQPTNTPVSQAGFDELFNERLTEFSDLGGTEADFRRLIELQLLSAKLQDVFAEEQGLTTEEEQVSILYISFQNEAEAQTVVADVAGGKPFLTAWNEIRSADRVTNTQPFASEFQFAAVESISGSLGAEVGDVLQTLEVGTTSDVIANDTGRFVVVYLRGREDRPLTEARIDQQKREMLQEWLVDAEKDAIIYESRWESNVPDRPILDPKYFTPVEQEPVIPEVVPEITPES